MDSHDNDGRQSDGADGDDDDRLAPGNQASTNPVRGGGIQSDFSAILALLFRRFDFRQGPRLLLELI